MTDKLKKLFSNKYFKAIYAFVFIVSSFSFICIKANAAGSSGSIIPYNVSQMASYNQVMFDNNNCQLAIDYALNNNFISTDDSILIFTTDGLYNRDRLFQYTFIVNPYCEQIVTDDFDYLTNTITFKTDSEIFNVLVHISSGASGSNTQHLTQAALFGTSSSVSTSLGSFLPRYPFYYNGEPILSANGKVVLIANGNSSLVTGSATAPTFGAGAGTGGSDFLGSGADFGASLSQAIKPSPPTLTSYTWNTYNAPPVDTSTLESLIQSLIDIVKYNATYITEGITGLISNLLSNIQSLFNYIGGLLEYLGRTIITNIQNGIQNLYDNIQSLFEPLLNSITEMITGIKEKFDYYFEPLDKEECLDYFEDNSTAYSLYADSSSFISEFTTSLSNVSAPQRLVFSVDFSSGPWPFSEMGTVTFNFDWYENLRHTIVPIILTMLYVGAIYNLICQIPNLIHGTSGLFSPQLTETHSITTINTSTNSSSTRITNSYMSPIGIGTTRSYSSYRQTRKQR